MGEAKLKKSISEQVEDRYRVANKAVFALDEQGKQLSLDQTMHILVTLLAKAMVLGRWWHRQESVEDRRRGLTLAATSAALGLCPSVVMCVVLLFERPFPLLAVGYLSLFSTLQGFLLRSVKNAFAASNESAGILKHILIGLIGSLLFIIVMLAVGGGGL